MNQQLKLTTEFEVTSVAPSVSTPQEHMALVTVSAAHMTTPNPAPPITLSVALDVSSSMEKDNKLEDAKRLLGVLTAMMRPVDRFGLVTFASEATVQLSLTAMDDPGKEQARAILNNLRAEGATDLLEGFSAAGKLLEGEGEKGRCALLAFTDGRHQPSEADENMELLQANMVRALKASYSTYTFGFGNDVNAAVLRHVAQACHGMYYAMLNKDDMTKAFADAVGGLYSVVATRVVVDIVTSPQVQIQDKISVDKSLVEHPVPGVTRVNLGDVQAGESRDIVLRVTLDSDLGESDAVPILAVTLTTRESDAQVACLMVPVTMNAPHINTNVIVQHLRSRAGKTLSKASLLMEQFNKPAAVRRLKRAIKDMQASPVRNHPVITALVAKLTALAADCQSNSVSSSFMHMEAMSQLSQRSGVDSQLDLMELEKEGAALSPYQTPGKRQFLRQVSQQLSQQEDQPTPPLVLQSSPSKKRKRVDPEAEVEQQMSQVMASGDDAAAPLPSPVRKRLRFEGM
jgi:hypothetical protein